MVAGPEMPPLVAVLVTEPAATAVTSPLPLTVATAALLLDQVTTAPVSAVPFASLGVAVNCTVCPTDTLADAGLTVTDATDEATGGGSSAAVVPLATFETLPNTAVPMFSVPRNGISWNW